MAKGGGTIWILHCCCEIPGMYVRSRPKCLVVRMSEKFTQHFSVFEVKMTQHFSVFEVKMTLAVYGVWSYCPTTINHINLLQNIIHNK